MLDYSVWYLVWKERNHRLNSLLFKFRRPSSLPVAAMDLLIGDLRDVGPKLYRPFNQKSAVSQS